MSFKFRNLLKIFVLFGSIFFLSKNIDLSELTELLNNAMNWKYLFIPLIFIFFQVLFGLIKNLILINYKQRNRITFNKLLLPTLLSYLVDQISIIGYFIVKLILLKNLKIKMNQILFASFFDKLTSLITKIIFAFPIIIFLIISIQIYNSTLIIGFVIMIILIFCIFNFRKNLFDSLNKFFSKYNIEYLKIVYSKEIYISLLLALISQIFIYLAYLSILYFLNYNIFDEKLLYLLPVGILIASLPLSLTPWFYRETSFIIILSYALITNEGSIAMSIIFTTMHIILLSISSLIIFLYEFAFSKDK